MSVDALRQRLTAARAELARLSDLQPSSLTLGAVTFPLIRQCQIDVLRLTARQAVFKLSVAVSVAEGCR